MFDFGLPAFFEILAEPQRETLRSLARERTYRDGQSLHEPGDPADTMGWIESGALLFGKYLEDEGFHSLVRLGPGHHYGEFGALPYKSNTMIPRRLAAVADGQTIVNEVAAEKLTSLFTEDTEYLRAFHIVTSARLALLIELYDDARRLNARQRIINFLGIIDRMQADGKSIDCTQADISRMLGLSKGTGTQTLRTLTDRGVISVGYGSIRFEESDRLHSLTDRA